MPDAAEKLMSLDEFLAWERQQPERYEFDGLVARMMTGGSLDRSTIASNLWTVGHYLHAVPWRCKNHCQSQRSLSGFIRHVQSDHWRR